MEGRRTGEVELLASRYRLEEELGRGAMGRVHRAYDTVLDRTVAIKFVTDVGDDVRARLQREAVATSRLAHANVMVSHHVGVHEGELFLVMEHIEGPPLRELVRSGGLPVPRVIEVALGLCEGLTALHAIDVLHRDLKPDNVIIRKGVDGGRGHPVLVDFGLARLPDVHSSEAVYGTPEYIAPERLLGAHVDASSDVYSLGVMLYELVFGSTPFEDVRVDVILKRVMDTSRPTSVDLPDHPAFAQLLEEMMSREPSARPRDASAVLKRLRAFGSLSSSAASSDDLSVIAVAGAPLPALVQWCRAEGIQPAQTVGDSELLIGVDHCERAFVICRDLRDLFPNARFALETGSGVDVGGLLAGVAVGCSARLVTLASRGDILIGPGAHDALGLGFLGDLTSAGIVSLPGLGRAPIFAVRRIDQVDPTAATVHVVSNTVFFRCPCGHESHVPLAAVATRNRFACQDCGSAIDVDVNVTRGSMAKSARAPGRDVLIRHRATLDETATLMNDLGAI